MLTAPVDVALLPEGTPEGSARVAAEIGAAALAFFLFIYYITGHDVDPALVADVFTASAAFFVLPAEAKRLVS